MVDSASILKGWVKYSAYGTPYGFPAGDTDSDGACSVNERNQVQTWITNAVYDVRGDTDLDGDVDSQDKTNVRTMYEGVTLGREVLSASSVLDRKGFAGYEALSGLVGGKWIARNRCQEPALGRWIQRDPLMEFMPMGSYEYCHESPVALVDAMGLIAASAPMGGPRTGTGGEPYDTGTHVDPPLPPPPVLEDCCKRAFEEINDPQTAGTVACCRGTKIVCAITGLSWRSKPRPGMEWATKLEDELARCVAKHESFHYWNSPDCDKSGVYAMPRPFWSGPANEYLAITVQQVCLGFIKCENLVPKDDPKRALHLAQCARALDVAKGGARKQKKSTEGYRLNHTDMSQFRLHEGSAPDDHTVYLH
jgi:RHS repeat-associated protein